MGLRTWRGRATPPPKPPHPPEHNLIQRPELIRALANRLGLKQPHVLPAMNEGVQAVVVLDTLPAPQADQARIAARGNIAGGVPDGATLMSCVGVWNRPGSAKVLRLVEWYGACDVVASQDVIAAVQTDNAASYTWPLATPYETYYLDTPTTPASAGLLADDFVVIGGRRTSISTSVGLIWSGRVATSGPLSWVPRSPVLIHPGEILTIQMQTATAPNRLNTCFFVLELVDRK